MTTKPTAKHTPGPWYQDGLSIYDGTLRIADVDGRWERSLEFARLIAAAPELLAELKSLAEIVKKDIEDFGGCDHSVGICMCPEIRKLESAVEIIAKAEGRS